MSGEQTPDENQEVVQMREMLRAHIGLPRRPAESHPVGQPRGQNPLFFIERAPRFPVGVRCNLPSCDRGNIMRGEYRVAVKPSMEYASLGRQGGAEVYHVSCFEKIADLSQAAFLGRITPVTRLTSPLRDITSVLDGKYLLDGGAERLALQWKLTRGRHIAARDGVAREQDGEGFPGFLDLNNAGLPAVEPRMMDRMAEAEFINLSTTLASTESDGPEDTQAWDLFDEYLTSRDPSSLEGRHELSDMLTMWRAHAVLANLKEEGLNRLTDEMRQERARLSPKAIRALQRLSQVPMPGTEGL